MENICDRNKCTGCGLCAALCPKQAVKLIIDGIHYFPSIDQAKCINCGLCKKKCLVNSPTILWEPRHCYAAWSKNPDLHFECASGGLATILSDFFIDNGGYVAGCVWDENMHAVTIATNRKEDLIRLSKSKYVHSYFSSDSYKKIRELLNKGEKVLFIGVPCQCAALQTFCSSKKENLFVVDLLCHGGASPKIFDNYLNSISKDRERIVDVTFRGGRYDCNLCIWEENKKLIYVGPQFEDPYFYSFMQHTIYRNSCLSCMYVGTSRPADLTLADFWGLDSSFISEQNLQTGVNLVITHTDKGESLLAAVRERIQCHERHLSEAINGNETLRCATPKPSKYDILNWAFLKIDNLKLCLYIFDWKYLKLQSKRKVKSIIKKIVPNSLIERLK